jgi:hypothetical protein
MAHARAASHRDHTGWDKPAIRQRGRSGWPQRDRRPADPARSAARAAGELRKRARLRQGLFLRDGAAVDRDSRAGVTMEREGWLASGVPAGAAPGSGGAAPEQQAAVWRPRARADQRRVRCVRPRAARSRDPARLRDRRLLERAGRPRALPGGEGPAHLGLIASGESLPAA